MFHLTLDWKLIWKDLKSNMLELLLNFMHLYFSYYIIFENNIFDRNRILKASQYCDWVSDIYQWVFLLCYSENFQYVFYEYIVRIDT